MAYWALLSEFWCEAQAYIRRFAQNFQKYENFEHSTNSKNFRHVLMLNDPTQSQIYIILVASQEFSEPTKLIRSHVRYANGLVNMFAIDSRMKYIELFDKLSVLKCFP